MTEFECSNSICPDMAVGMPNAHNTMPLLNEVRQALKRLIRTGESSIIDLRAMPFGPGDEQRLRTLLGEGEVEAHLEALGMTSLRETSFSGVWLVAHHNSEGERIAFQIEVAEVPALLCAQQADMCDGLEKLDELLKENPQ